MGGMDVGEGLSREGAERPAVLVVNPRRSCELLRM